MSLIDDLRDDLDLYARKWGGPGIGSPANHRADTYCKECDQMVRMVHRPPESHHCPLCGRRPGILELGVTSPEEYRAVI